MLWFLGKTLLYSNDTGLNELGNGASLRDREWGWVWYSVWLRLKIFLDPPPLTMRVIGK